MNPLDCLLFGFAVGIIFLTVKAYRFFVELVRELERDLQREQARREWILKYGTPADKQALDEDIRRRLGGLAFLWWWFH